MADRYQTGAGLAWVGVAVALAWLPLGAACNGRGAKVDASMRVFERVTATAAERLELQLAASAAVTFDARDPSTGADAVLQLWDLTARTEVARGEASAWLGRRAQLSYRNPHAQLRRYLLLVRARSRSAYGRVDLYRDGRRLQRARVGGTLLEVAGGRGYSYQVAAAPSGLKAATLYALDASGKLLGFDEHSGPTGMPKLAGLDAVRELLVTPAGETARGELSVYANDGEDGDGDGLGRELERALGTCDGPREPGCRAGSLAGYYRALHDGTRDTDRDGLGDAEELFGVAADAGALDLPRFGADPRHKDVFVEVDRQARVEGPGLDEQDITEIAALFAAGGAEDLRNPDHLPGVRLHLDIGIEPRERAHLGLFGDWGGSNRVERNNYKEARERDFTPSRRRYFRYALLARSGTGQAHGDAFTINRDLHRVPVFAHELAHTLGLEHHGHDAWGKANCKPNYYSIMNYVYQNRPEVGFSTGVTRALNPAHVIEREGLGARAFPLLGEPPLELDSSGSAVDWNRDGLISESPVRAGLSWATYKSCGAAEQGRQTLFDGQARAATPVLVKTEGRLHALWLDAAGHLIWRSGAVSGPDAHGSCPGGDRARAACMSWSNAREVPGLAGLRQIAALAMAKEQLALAFVADDGRVHAAVLDADERAPVVLADAVIPGAQSVHAPALAWLRVDEARYGATRVLGVFWRAAGAGDTGAGALMQASARTPAGPFHTQRVRDQHEQPITSAFGPTLATLGTGELCGVFTDDDAYIRFYCYDAARDAWADLSARAFYAGLGPRTQGQVGLAYHRYRAADGTLVNGDPSRGALYLSFTEPDADSARFSHNPHFYVSEWLNAEHAAMAEIDFRWRGSVINQWTHLEPGTGVAIYEDETLSALKGLMASGTDRPGVSRIEFLPLADGAYDEEFGTGNDFQVMERGICTRLRGDQACGGPNTASY